MYGRAKKSYQLYNQEEKMFISEVKESDYANEEETELDELELPELELPELEQINNEVEPKHVYQTIRQM